jgi:group I intron endonuclease
MQITKTYNGINVTYQSEEDMTKKNLIYLLEFPNGKVYVGQTTNTINHRLASHCSISSPCVKLNRAIQKYKEIRAHVLSSSLSQDQLNVFERFFINSYDSISSGYNLREGGSRGKHSPETIEKMSEAKKGHKLSDDGKAKISKALKGRIVTEETKSKHSATCASKRLLKPIEYKSVYVDTGTGIEYNTMKEIGVALGVSRQRIEQMLKKQHKRIKKIKKPKSE